MDLMKIGFTEYESKIYASLLKMKKGDAENISKVSGVPKTAVYPSLKSLVDKNLVQIFNSKPVEYEILSPKRSISNYLLLKEKEKEKINNKIIEDAEKIYNNKYDYVKESPIINLTKGKELSKEFYHSNFKNAKQSFYILGWRLKKIGDKYQMLHKLIEMQKRGVDLRLIITGVGNKQVNLIKDYQKSKIKIKYLPIDNFSMTIVDGEICKLTLKNINLADKYNLEIFDKDLSTAMHNYFLSLWDKAGEF